MGVHQQHGRIAIIEIVVDVLVVHFGRELVILVPCLIIDTGSSLPSFLRLDIKVGKLPCVSRRHDRRVRHLMDILVHRVEAHLQRDVFLDGIERRQAKLRSLIGLNDSCLLTPDSYQSFL